VTLLAPSHWAFPRKFLAVCLIAKTGSNFFVARMGMECWLQKKQKEKEY